MCVCVCVCVCVCTHACTCIWVLVGVDAASEGVVRMTVQDLCLITLYRQAAWRNGGDDVIIQHFIRCGHEQNMQVQDTTEAIGTKTCCEHL